MIHCSCHSAIGERNTTNANLANMVWTIRQSASNSHLANSHADNDLPMPPRLRYSLQSSILWIEFAWKNKKKQNHNTNAFPIISKISRPTHKPSQSIIQKKKITFHRCNTQLHQPNVTRAPRKFCSDVDITRDSRTLDLFFVKHFQKQHLSPGWQQRN